MTEDIQQASESASELSRQTQILGHDFDNLSEEFAKLSREGKSFASGLERDLTGAMQSVVVEGGSLSSSLKKLALSMADRGFEAALAPAMKGFSVGVASLMPFAKGGVIEGGRVRAFAQGGVVNSPTYFPMQGGVGLMGEAGAEAIVPLARGADGRLGLQSGNRSAVNITLNVSSPDAVGFRKSQSQIAAQLQRAISMADR